MPDPLRVAVVGGSIGGCTLALGLLKHPRIQFDVFERSTFRERGAGILIYPNGMNALRVLGIDADQMMKDAGAFRSAYQNAVVAYGEHKDKVLWETSDSVQSVIRTNLLEQMLQRLPAERLHEHKLLVSIEEGESLTLHFADGSSYEADAVVGCDGIRSTIRGIILGPQHPAVPPINTGFWDARAVVSSEKGLEKFGSTVITPESPRQGYRCGEGCIILFVSGPPGSMAAAIVGGKTGPGDEHIKEWKTPITRDFLERKYANWGSQEYLEGVFECLLTPGAGPGVLFQQWESQPAPTWWRKRICMMGDAAHATTPWMGQGFSMVAEDAAVLTGLLGNVRIKEEVEYAFEAYDKTRRGGRPEFVIENSRLVAELACGSHGFDPATVALSRMEEKYRWVWDGDVKKEVSEAVEYFEALKRS